ncbi:Hypothetical predicted protein [Scomber scombrus]|uniref:Uncharacterized protein n=1 Tax=Scomber scombrus TaxID=13677 RepID=A0AAV1NUT6_SCOSC
MQRFNENEKEAPRGWRVEEKDGKRWRVVEEERSKELKVELESYESSRTRFSVLGQRRAGLSVRDEAAGLMPAHIHAVSLFIEKHSVRAQGAAASRWQGRKEKVGESEMVRKENADDVMNNRTRVRRLGRHSVGDGGKGGRGKDSEQVRGQELKMTMTNSE